MSGFEVPTEPVVMPRNLHHYERRWNPKTQQHEDVPIPFPCGCGALSCYGRCGIWYCSPCWQARHQSSPSPGGSNPREP